MTDKEYEEGAAGTNKDRKSDPLKEYSTMLSLVKTLNSFEKLFLLHEQPLF